MAASLLQMRDGFADAGVGRVESLPHRHALARDAAIADHAGHHYDTEQGEDEEDQHGDHQCHAALIVP
jgi:hypothetical protein